MAVFSAETENFSHYSLRRTIGLLQRRPTEANLACDTFYQLFLNLILLLLFLFGYFYLTAEKVKSVFGGPLHTGTWKMYYKKLIIQPLKRLQSSGQF